MAIIEFTEQDGLYTATVVVNKDYALHIEREGIGTFAIKQRSTSEGNYGECIIPSAVQAGYWKTLDWVFAHGFYPMNVQFVSSVPITKAELNEVTE